MNTHTATISPEQLVDAVSAKLTTFGITVDPVAGTPRAAIATAAAARLMWAFGIDLDLADWPGFEREDPAMDEPHIRRSAASCGQKPPVYDPEKLIGSIREILIAAGERPEWPYVPGRGGTMSAAVGKLQRALGVLPYGQLVDVIDRTYEG